MTNEQLAEGFRLAHEQLAEVVQIMLAVEHKLPNDHPERRSIATAIRKASDADLHFLILANRLKEPGSLTEWERTQT